MIPDAAAMMPDLTHLSAEERAIIEEVFQRQREEEQKEQEISQKADKELEDIERLINERKENAQRLVGTQGDAVCQSCQKTKFVDGIGHKCFYCQLRSCTRCGCRTTSKNKTIWACSTCQKRQQILARTGKWFQSNQPSDDFSENGPSSSTLEGLNEESEEADTTNGGVEAGQLQKSAEVDIPQPTPSNPAEPVRVPTQTQAPATKAIPPTTRKPSAPMSQSQQPQQANQQQQQPQPRPVQQQPAINQQQRRQQQPQSRIQNGPRGPQPQSRPQSELRTTPKPMPSNQPSVVRQASSGSQLNARNANRGPSPASQRNEAERRSGYESQVASGVSPSSSAAAAAAAAANPAQVPAVPQGMESRAASKPLGPTVLHGTGARVRRNKLSRQIRSLSSSEDDDGSALNRRRSVVEPDFSERDLLKYIYGKHPKTTGTASTSLPASRSALYETHSNSSPALNHFSAHMATQGQNPLASRIRYFLQQPVSWQPSADQRRLIGHIVLQRPEADQGDLGLKVVGGRNSSTGRLGAFITAVKADSVADYVGQLRPGDEVLEWNGETLQNMTHEHIYHIINRSKEAAKVELIVSRPILAGSDDFLNVGTMRKTLPQIPHPSPIAFSDYGPPTTGSPYPATADYYRIPHSKSMISQNPLYPPDYEQAIPETRPLRVRVPLDRIPPGQLFGKIEVSLLYLHHEQELVVTVYHALDLPPRPSGALRSPFVKLFLLPDRSEESSRQSKVIENSLNPNWNECFYYYGLTLQDLYRRCLELTVWDYDHYNGHNFLGETVVDLSDVLLENQRIAYPLVDMDDENPIKLRIRRSKASYASQQERYRSHSANYDDHRSRQDYDYLQSVQYGRDYPDGAHRPRSEYADWNSGYASDYGQYSRPPPHGHSRRPKSATGFRHGERLSSGVTVRSVHDYENRYRSQPIHEEPSPSQLYPDAPNDHHAHPPVPQHKPSYKYNDIPSDGPMRNRQHDAVLEQSNAGYGSDGSETLSANSAQSMQKRNASREEQQREYQRDQAVYDQTESYSPRHHFYDNHQSYESQPRSRGLNGRTVRMDVRTLHEEDENGADLNGDERSVRANGSANASSQLAMKERKKSLMTRLMPGRNAPNDMKRTGFARSEEVGIPDGGGNNGEQQAPFTKQSSKDSTDSSDNWQPLMPDAMLGHFMEDLGPGQVVGRQVLASPVLGEIELALGLSGHCLIVDVIRAKNLVVRPGSKLNPAPYVKVYLMQGKHCVAKAKTQPARKTTAPLFNQQLSFGEPIKHKLLQVTVLGDYGRMERKSTMGCVLIRLDELNLQQSAVKSWFKLFHNNSIMGAAPVRKDSETSLNEM